MSASKISLVLLSVLLPAVSCSRFKIAIPDESSAERARDGLAKRADGACSDFEIVSSPMTLSFPDGFKHLKRPWIGNYPAYAGTSETVTNGINRLFTLKVPGLEGQTIMEVIGILKRNGCLSFPFGGAVRDQFLGSTPKDLDMESNCDADTLYRICKENWDRRSMYSNCHRNASVTNPIIHIGNSSAKDGETEPLDAANWNETFFGNGTALEYTTNSIAFIGEGLNIIIDLTGSGVSDTCNKFIRIPTNDRDHWVSRTKVYRYWKLRVKGYTPVDADTMTFITDMAKHFIDEQPDPSLKFYCETVLHGKWASPTCQIDSCEAAISNKTQYDKYLEMDLGAFWIDTAKEMVDNLSVSQCGCVRPGKQKRQYSAGHDSSCSFCTGDACNGSQGLTLFLSPFLLLVLSLILGAEIVV